MADDSESDISIFSSHYFVILIIIVSIIIIITFIIYGVHMINNGPLTVIANDIYQKYLQTITYGIEIEIYDLSANEQVNRLFILRPENYIIYNNQSSVYIYLMVSGRAGIKCNNNEEVIVEFNRNNITNAQSGEFTLFCTSVTAINLIEFFTIKQPYPIEKINIQLLDENSTYNIIDIINLLIEQNYINLKQRAVRSTIV